MAEHSESASLVIGEAERAASDFGAKDAILFKQIGDGVRVTLVKPRGKREEEPAHGRRVHHAGEHNPERLAFWVGRLMGHSALRISDR